MVCWQVLIRCGCLTGEFIVILLYLYHSFCFCYLVLGLNLYFFIQKNNTCPVHPLNVNHELCKTCPRILGIFISLFRKLFHVTLTHWMWTMNFVTSPGTLGEGNWLYWTICRTGLGSKHGKWHLLSNLSTVEKTEKWELE